MRGATVKAFILAAAFLAWVGVRAAETAAAEPERPKIEVVFVLDTTGSMSHLIQAAKEKIWAIANTLAAAKPAPEIKMGLVGYRDRGDAYVTKRTDLTDDLDAVYEQLLAFQASGGGDGPESVNQALHEAVTSIAWSDDKQTYRVIFLVGDYPPHMDYEDDVKYPETCELAAKKGIIVNTVQCGTHGPTMPVWREIASLAEGRYFQVEQSGSAILASTPFDARLSELSRELDETRLYYGSAEVKAAQEARKAMADRIYEVAAPSATAQRAAFNVGEAGKFNFAGGQELIQDVADGTVKLAEIEEKELPENMRKMSPEEREKYLAKMSAKREELQAQVKELAAKRQAHIEDQVRNTKLAGEQSLDSAVFECVQEQAARKGIQYTGGPSY